MIAASPRCRRVEKTIAIKRKSHAEYRGMCNSILVHHFYYTSLHETKSLINSLHAFLHCELATIT